MSRETHNAKIGNILKYFATEIHDLNITKSLKLLFLLDEKSFIDRGIPVTCLEYKVWEQGPVAETVWKELSLGKPDVNELTNELLTFSDCITTEQRVNFRGSREVILHPIGTFERSHFSRREIKLLEEINTKYGHLTAKQLSEITHRKGTPWYNAAVHNNLLEHFGPDRRTSNVVIDLSELIDSESKRDEYNAFMENLDFKKTVLRNRSSLSEE